MNLVTLDGIIWIKQASKQASGSKVEILKSIFETSSRKKSINSIFAGLKLVFSLAKKRFLI